jgi:hypothetical protein
MHCFKYVRIAVTSSVAVVVSACGDDPVSASRQATFSAQVTAPLALAFDGRAEFRPDLPLSTIGNAFLFRVPLNEAHAQSPSRHVISIFRHSTEPLVAGTFAIDVLSEPVDPTRYVASVLLERDGARYTCYGVLGEIAITAVSADRATGRFSFSADCSPDEGEATHDIVAISGEFDAVLGSFGPDPMS